jgi:hypothetical protein
MKEPFINEELIRISLEAHYIHLVFTETILQIGASFFLLLGDSIPIHPDKRAGDTSRLWSLIGQTVTNALWNDEIVFTFSGGAKIRIPATPGRTRGTIQGRRTINDMLVFQDF